MSALRPYGRRGHPFLGVVALDGAGRSMHRLKVTRGHRNGGHGCGELIDVVVIVDDTKRRGRERMEALAEARGITGRRHI